MIRPIILSIVFSIGLLYSMYEVLNEYKTRKNTSNRKSYKMRYYILWGIIFSYLIYAQWINDTVI